jgi:FlaA1/EpsC-like NDP-sugar epimerase
MQSARRFRGLSRLGTLLDALIIIAALAIAVHIEWHTPFRDMPWFWRYRALSNVSTWKLVAAFSGFAVVLLWISSHHRESALRKRTLLLEQKLNLQDCLVSGLFLIAALYLTDAETLSRGFVLLFVVLVAVGLGLRRLIYRTIPSEHVAPRNVLIIGADATARALREQLRDATAPEYAFKGFVKLSDSEPDSLADPGEVVGTIDELTEHVYKYSVNGLFLTPSCDRAMTVKIVRQAREMGIETRMVPGHIRFAAKRKKRSRV